MKEFTVISNDADCFIELIHRHSNPTVWIVRRSKKVLWFKKEISSGWFTDGHQALLFAKKMKRDNCSSVGKQGESVPRHA
jgi:hypothetical protein